MSWKSDLRLSDLAPDAILECTCRRCGLTRTRPARDHQGRHGALRIDAFEARLRCPDRMCRGAVRLALEHQMAVEGFVGGLA